MEWIARSLNLLEGQRYLKYLSVAYLILFLGVGFLLWHKAEDSSFYSFQDHLLQRRDELDFRLSMLEGDVQRLDHIFDQPSTVNILPKPQPVRISIEPTYGVLETHQALDKPSMEVFARFKEYAPFFLRGLYKRFPNVERIYFVSSAISFVAPFLSKNTLSDINDKNNGITSYNYGILSRLSSYFTGWSPAYYHGKSWHVRYIHPCYSQRTLLGFFAVHIGPSFFKRYLRSLIVPFGHVFLVADNGDILLEKNSKGFGDSKRVSEKITSYVRHVVSQKNTQSLGNKKPYRINLMTLKSGPWTLCFVTPNLSLLHRAMGSLNLLFLWSNLAYVAIGLLALLSLNIYLVHLGFIRPMRMIMNHIHQERLNLKTNLSHFSRPWKYWAQLISTSFVEKRNRSARLESTLKERMGDLSRMMDYLKKNQYQLISGEHLMSLGGTAIGIAYEMCGFLAYMSNLIKYSQSTSISHDSEILSYINRCNKLLTEVLICSHSGDDTFVPVDLNELLKRYVKLSTLCFFSKNAPIPVLVNMQLPVHTLTCLGVKHQLGAALFSMVSQALESAFYGYTNNPDVLPRVDVKLVAHDYNCTIHIKDTGPFLGSNAKEELLQDPDESRTSLQVASCLSIIQGHDGTIFFSEEQENHTTVVLPLHKMDVQPKSA